MSIRAYEEQDWAAIERIHDGAGKAELKQAGLEEGVLWRRCCLYFSEGQLLWVCV